MALVTFADGQRELWEPLSAAAGQTWSRMLFVRSFKFEFSLFSPGGDRLYRPVCEFLAEEALLGGRTVQSIELIRLTQQVNGWNEPERFGPERADVIFRWPGLAA